MDPGILQLVVHGLITVVLFAAGGAIAGIAAIEIDNRLMRSSGMQALGWWVFPMILFWLICILGTVLMIRSDPSLLNILVT